MDLLLVESDATFAASLAESLRALDHRVTVAADDRTAGRMMDRQAQDAVILGRPPAGTDLATLARRMRTQGITLPVVIVSTQARVIDRIEGLEAGADDYMVRPVDAAELDARLKALARARRWTAQGDTIRAGDILVSPGQMRAWRGEVALDLGATEFALLAELARAAGTVVTRARLLERVWGHQAAPATNILDAQICRLRGRLAQAGRPDPIVTRRGIGYLLRP